MKQLITKNTVDVAFFIIFIPILLILALLSYWHFGSFFGFAIGSLIAYLSIKINIVIASFLSSRSSKGKIVKLIIVKNFVFLILIGIIIYLCIQINGIYIESKAIIGSKWNYVNNPINLIALLVGLFILFPTYILEYLLQKYLARRWNE
ncbi:Uncharacterised protein [Mycoplasmopsis citelli]|uniref:Uncharacterized protein n=1 Tax=Mycoplasmopsis citelli TaxID=171281 RepID=A0A449B1J0_9BACT|nr:hypothetical protein [Mycoplasmopsis citelli]VEU74436.1 Uncharacterised protein [Mycoplasmopsis citelli]